MSARDRFEPAHPDYVQQVLQGTFAMPIVRFLGVQPLSIEPGRVELVLPYKDELSWRPGHFQGAAVSAAGYYAATASLNTLLPAGMVGMSLDHTIKYLAAAEGDKLIARGRAVSPGRSIGVAASDVFVVKDGRERLCATLMVTTRNTERRG